MYSMNTIFSFINKFLSKNILKNALYKYFYILSFSHYLYFYVIWFFSNIRFKRRLLIAAFVILNYSQNSTENFTSGKNLYFVETYLRNWESSLERIVTSPNSNWRKLKFKKQNTFGKVFNSMEFKINFRDLVVFSDKENKLNMM